jgi:hypothetical protein
MALMAVSRIPSESRAPIAVPRILPANTVTMLIAVPIPITHDV